MPTDIKLCKRCKQEPGDEPNTTWGDVGLCLGCYKKSKTCYSCGKFYPKGLTNKRCEECTETLKEAHRDLEEQEESIPQPQPSSESNNKNEKALYRKTDDNGNQGQLVVQRMDTIKAEKIDWIWPGKLPLGMFSIFAGRMGSGKGLTWSDIVARITTGRDWPDGAPNTLGGPQMVLIAATEDDPAKVVRPRLEAAGTDLTKVLWLKRVEKVETIRRKEKKSKRHLILDRDLDYLHGALINHKDIALVILDPLSSFFNIKITDDKEVRPYMDLITLMCARSGAGLLAISHTNKRSDVDSTQRILGASSIAGSARMIWNFAYNPDDKTERLMSLVKSNIGATKGQKFRVKPAMVRLEDGLEAETACCEWLGDHDEDADEVMQKSRENKFTGDRQKDMAMAFIRMKLSDGMKPARDLYREADKEGIAEKTLQRAKYALGVRSVPNPNGGKGWCWTMAPQAEDPTIKPQEVM
jgi:putative DNA primase/helicase